MTRRAATKRKTPQRGDPDSNVLIEGDTGIFAGPLGGAEPGATESGDLASREYGVPQADIPGGVRHVVNPQTRHARPPGVPERPADYHKEHGVEPLDNGQYVTPPDATEERPSRAAPEPVAHDAIPVYLTQGPGKQRVLRHMVAEQVAVVGFGGSAEPTRLASKDPNRVEVHLRAITPAQASTEADGVVISGTKNVPWLFLTLPPGTYDVEWIVWQEGTLTVATDGNNIQLISSNNSNNFIAQAQCPGQTGYYSQEEIKGVEILAGQTAGHYLALQPAPNTPTTGSIYGGQIIATPVAHNVQFAEDQATVIEGRGAVLRTDEGYLNLTTQGDIYAASTDSEPAVVSIVLVTEMPE